MTRRLFFGIAGLAIGAKPAEHVHEFGESPFWLSASISFEGPGYYSPSRLVAVELCKCGAVRIPPQTAEKMVGKTYMQQTN